MPTSPTPAGHHNRILEKAYRRADRLEGRLARLVEPVLLQAADHAAANFERLAVDHSALAASGTVAGAAPSGARGGHPMKDDGEASPEPGGDSPRAPATFAVEPGSTKAMVALKPRPEEADAIALPGGEPAWTLHQTLAFLGEVEGDLEPVLEALRPVAARHQALQGAVGGAGAFEVGDGPHPQILLPDVPGMAELRVAVTEALHRAGVGYAREHGFAPHVTVGYQDAPQAPQEPPYGAPLHFDALWVVRGDSEAHELPLLGQAPAVTAAASRPFCLPAELRTKTDPVRLAVANTVAKAAVEGAGVAFDATNPLISKALVRSASQITNIAQTTQLDVMRTIRASYDEGLSIPDTAKAIQAVMKEAAPARARLIARTELAGAVNGASLAATQVVQEETGAAYLKVWMTAPGAPNPRHEMYEGLDGQERPLEAPFDVDGSDLMYPGDPSGPPDEVCNCRCTVSYVDRAGNEADGGDEAELTASAGSRRFPALVTRAVDAALADARARFAGRPVCVKSVVLRADDGEFERDLTAAFMRPLYPDPLDEVEALQALTAAAGPAGWAAPAASEVLDVGCEPAHAALEPARVPLAEEKIHAAAPSEAVAGSRPWIHLKDSSLKSSISHAKTDLSRTTDERELTRIRAKLEGLQRELDIRTGTIAEPRPWQHLKDTTLKSHISHARGDLRKATDPAERARLEAKLADLNRELELRGGTTTVRTTVEKPQPPEPRPWAHLKETTLKSYISHAKGDLRRAADGAEKDRIRAKLAALERELELRRAGQAPPAGPPRDIQKTLRESVGGLGDVDPAQPTAFGALQYFDRQGKMEEGVLYRTAAGKTEFSQGGTYTAKAGYTAKVGDALVFVEDGGKFPAPQAVEAFRRQFGSMQRNMAAEQAAKLRTVDVFNRRCPTDKWFAKTYRRPGFRAAATAGRGQIHYWNDSGENLAHTDGHNILAHEMGHIVGTDNGPPSEIEWRQAQARDKAWSSKQAAREPAAAKPAAPVETRAVGGPEEAGRLYDQLPAGGGAKVVEIGEALQEARYASGSTARVIVGEAGDVRGAISYGETPDGLNISHLSALDRGGDVELVRAAARDALERGLDNVYLWARDAKDADFYASLGFAPANTGSYLMELRGSGLKELAEGTGTVAPALPETGGLWRTGYEPAGTWNVPRYGRDTVSDYAATTVKEEWAESIRLYLENAERDPEATRFGTVRDPKTGMMRPATFADVYPNRAEIIEERLRSTG